MPDIWLDVDTAVIIPVTKVPLVLKSDGTTISATVAYNAAGMDLNWNFVTSAGVSTHTNVVPTTTGVHDWTGDGGGGQSGIYFIEIPASTGTVNNDTEGFGWWSGETTAEAAFTSPIYGFRAAALNNALIDGGDTLDVNMVTCDDVAQTGTDIGAKITTMEAGIIEGIVGSTNLTNTTCSSNLTTYTVDQLVGRVIVFLTGDADGEATRISGYVVANGVITFDALSGAIAPANTDTFKIV